LDIGWRNRWEPADAQPVAAKLAVRLNIDNAILAQDLGDDCGIDGLIEVDGSYNKRARSFISNIRSSFIPSLSPVVQSGGRLSGALDHAVEATIVVHPLDLVG